jgi:UPF0042 nucleotide-binding protein
MTPLPERHRLVVVTGMSGAGKSTALKLLEDLGYEAVDNLPLGLLPRITEGEDGARRPIAIGLDTRTRGFRPETLAAKLDLLRGKTDVNVQLLFLDCDDEVLHNRFTATRRVHPLAQDRAVGDGIALERSLLTPIRERVDLMIDTSRLKLPDLREIITANFVLERDAPLNVLVTSFSYRHGLPREADLVFDVRFLDNPFYDVALRPLMGEDEAVAAHIRKDTAFAPFFERLTGLLASLLPSYARAGKRYLTIAIGCTGGRHRSVMVARALAEALNPSGFRIALRHRDIHLGGE